MAAIRPWGYFWQLLLCAGSCSSVGGREQKAQFLFEIICIFLLELFRELVVLCQTSYHDVCVLSLAAPESDVEVLVLSGVVCVHRGYRWEGKVVPNFTVPDFVDVGEDTVLQDAINAKQSRRK